MIAIVCDSTVSLTKKEAADMGVFIVPMSFSVAGRQMHEHFSDTNGAYDKLLTTFKCTTSQPSVAAFTSTFEELRHAGHQVLCIVISSRLSGTYSTALLAAKDVDKDNIRVVDSLTTTGGMRFLAERAGELIAAGGALEDIAADLENVRNRISIAFSVETMDPLRKSGRLGSVRQSIGTILNTRPILKCTDGTIVFHDFSKGHNQQLSKLVAFIPDTVKKIDIQHQGSESEAAALTALIRSRFPLVPITHSLLGPVLSIHIGIPVLGVAWLD